MTDETKYSGDLERKLRELQNQIAKLEQDKNQYAALESAHRENERHFQLLAENISDILWILDRDLCFTFISPSAKKISGYEAENIIGHALRDLLSSESISIVMKHYQEDLAISDTAPSELPQTRTLELELKHKNGHYFPVEAKISILRDAAGKLSGFLGITRDISERKKTEEALKASEENYRTIFNSANDAIFIHDWETGRVIDVNDTTCKMFGFTREEMHQQTILETTAADQIESLRLNDPAVFKDLWEQIAREGHLFEWHAKDKYNRAFWVEVHLKPITLGGKKRVMANVRDISERKQAIEAIQKGEQRLRLFIEDAGEPMMSVDNEGRILLASKRVANYVGIGMAELIGKTLWDVFAKDLDASGTAEMKEAIKKRKRFSKEYFVVFNGERKWYEIIVQPLTPTPGIDQVAQVIAHDITETVKAKTRDEARIRLLNELRSANDIDKCLEYGCRAIDNSQHYRRAVMTLHNAQREITNLGHVGLDKNIVDQARRGSAPDEKMRQSIMQDKFRISRSYFIPLEANLQLDKSERYVQPELIGNGGWTSWKNGDEFFVPMLSDDNQCEGWLSVDTPFDDRRPTIETALYLEEIVDIVTKKIREINSLENLKVKSRALEESNMALRAVLASIEHDKAEIRGKVSQFISDILLPTVDRLVGTDGTINKAQYSALKNGLLELISSPEMSLQSYPQLSPRELEICMMIKDGFTSKEISKSLNIALKTVNKHRQFIRHKLGIGNQKINLVTYLKTNRLRSPI
jgi:PAS domain S-box-containing protein